MTGYIPNERIVNRAVMLWQRMLSAPSFKALAPGERNPLMERAQELARDLHLDVAQEPSQRFGDLLKIALSSHDQEGCYVTYLSNDYDPDAVLSALSDEAGLVAEFPWKTSMELRTDCLSVKMGYGSAREYHYPLPDRRWLLTTLNGEPEDVKKLIDWSMSSPDSFLIESDDDG